uniref:Uncharacterized protein n=1 Tax=Oryza meridionalis TaxID=40149 RepID=A0A0E0CXE1_9ORYZ
MGGFAAQKSPLLNYTKPFTQGRPAASEHSCDGRARRRARAAAERRRAERAAAGRGQSGGSCGADLGTVGSAAATAAFREAAETMASPDPSSAVVEVLHGMTIPVELSDRETGLTSSSRRQSLTRRPRPSSPSRGRFLAAPAANAASSPPLVGITSSLAQAVDRRRLVASSALRHHPRRVGTARACGIAGWPHGGRGGRGPSSAAPDEATTHTHEAGRRNGGQSGDGRARRRAERRRASAAACGAATRQRDSGRRERRVGERLLAALLLHLADVVGRRNCRGRGVGGAAVVMAAEPTVRPAARGRSARRARPPPGLRRPHGPAAALARRPPIAGRWPP